VTPQEHGPASGCARADVEDAPDPTSSDLARAIVEATSTLVCVVDGDGRILLANRSLQLFTGQSADELVGRPFWEVYVVPEHVLLAQDVLARAMATGRAHPQEGHWLDGAGRRRLVATQNDVLVDEDGQPYAVACVALDVTEQRRREAQLHLRAQTDLLTGLPNRGALFEALSQNLEAPDGAGCGVLFCDLDHFKVVNDRFGHAVGDRLLVEVAARLRALTAPGEVVARFGGDEFVIVCPHGDEERLSALAGRVLDQVRRPFGGPAGDLVIGVSVGVAVGSPGESADDLIARADQAMYGIKTQRRRRRPRSWPDDRLR
jgi:cyclic di-GMP phosphodiesterase Gmr